MTQIPRKAESFSSLSRMFRSDVHLVGAKGGQIGVQSPPLHPRSVEDPQKSPPNSPGPDELLQHRGHLLRAHEAEAPDGDGWGGEGGDTD